MTKRILLLVAISGTVMLNAVSPDWMPHPCAQDCHALWPAMKALSPCTMNSLFTAQDDDQIKDFMHIANAMRIACARQKVVMDPALKPTEKHHQLACAAHRIRHELHHIHEHHWSPAMTQFETWARALTKNRAFMFSWQEPIQAKTWHAPEGLKESHNRAELEDIHKNATVVS